ncbi:hypothetical protein HanRHA438_Chr02g0088191 [Helianthus annuus]|nr:hypothetical protein HanRHA438_Chr02g0088191 [Helianthus annuus]
MSSIFGRFASCDSPVRNEPSSKMSAVGMWGIMFVIKLNKKHQIISLDKQKVRSR